MFNQLLVHQVIMKDTSVNVYYANASHINWTYETILKPNSKTNIEMFPIILTDEIVRIIEKSPGRETSCSLLPENRIRFLDDYNIPEGTVICVTGPKGYFPEIVKLKNKPTLVGTEYKNETPAHFEVKSNRFTNQASVLMHVMNRTYFGICIEFMPLDGGVPIVKDNWHRNEFDLTLGLLNQRFEIVKKSDVLTLHENLDEKILDEVVYLLNVIVEQINKSVDDECIEDLPIGIKERFSVIVPLLIATSSSLVTLIDSYSTGGTVGQLLAIIVKFFS